MKQKLKVIITGASGMVGEGVAQVCLENPDIEKVLVVGRRPSGLVHSKLEEIIIPDLMDLSQIKEDLKGYDACFFCLGISSVGIDAEDYYRTTYTLTIKFAEVLAGLNTAPVFCYVSGAGTDRSEKGRIRWARVKGKTENDLTQLGFRKVYGFRPGFIRPIKGLSHTSKYYRYVKWMFPIGRKLYPTGFCTMEELALSMIYLAKNDFEKQVISGLDIISLAQKEKA
ncbi:MAG: NAD-dependent epimerase/dehydratase family protein [Bacteroidales bacterium]|jgi:uncharacterized protein YbjT (DUF2867 family)|nr:NAD-dependent epimerase/dehydratase family protein [Bacteroidales bacterium]